MNFYSKSTGPLPMIIEKADDINNNFLRNLNSILALMLNRNNRNLMNASVKSFLIKIAFLALFVLSGFHTLAQVPQNLSTVSVDALTDAQIQQIFQRGAQAGQNDEEILNSLQARGLSNVEAQKLRSRRKSQQMVGNSSQSDSLSQGRRAFNGDIEPIVPRGSSAGGPAIFGANLFRANNNTFEPNLKLATPVNYIIGPEDQLDISVYGNSVVNWKLTVSPDGNINLPSGGVINVSGKTIAEATSLIRTRLISRNYAIGNGSTLKVTLGNIRSIKVIMVGEVVKPGTYTLPSLATAFNALYSSGGPNDNGSFREIEIIRNGRVASRLDIYDFLVSGSQKGNISLQDQDIIRVPGYRTRVEVRGEVKHPALFEILPGETLASLIRFAGSFTSHAYRAAIKVSQISNQQRRLTDVNEGNFKNYIPLPGDIYFVDQILNRFENRVTISGAVFRPGEYELQNGMTLKQLIEKTVGLREDAYTPLATLYRLNADNTKQILSFDLNDVMNNRSSVSLRREDSIVVKSIFDLRDRYTVQVAGAVRSPGQFAYADSMTVQNLIFNAGGFAEGASSMRIEVARRVDGTNLTNQTAKVYSVDIDSKLSPSAGSFGLKPFDIVMVYKQPGFEKQSTVQIIGEVLHPGPYAIINKTEKISDLLKRAGGITPIANADGSTLKRQYIASLGVNHNRADTAFLLRDRNSRINEIQQSYNSIDSASLNPENRNSSIGINLRKIIEKPGSSTDLILKDGDVIVVPQQQQVVQVNGEVHVPSGVVYEKGKGFRQYVLDAGGFTNEAQRRDAYIVYPNGSVRGTHKFLFFNSRPSVKPGSEIYVPKKPLRRSLSVPEVAGIISAVGSVILLGIIGLK